jgi:nucleoside-diphosphate-sugar epimerase
LPTADPTRRCPDISEAQRLLGWRPEIALEDGLARTVEYLAQRMGMGMGMAGSRGPERECGG